MIAFTSKSSPVQKSMRLDYDNKLLEYLYRIPMQTTKQVGYKMKYVGKLHRELKHLFELNNINAKYF
ncbi:hypothetical protein BAX95_17950 [Elizabethkingia meningoseptica]|nr:hypothetical protein BAX95_17950 [Elizabethkingia meningoseptica]